MIDTGLFLIYVVIADIVAILHFNKTRDVVTALNYGMFFPLLLLCWIFKKLRK